MNNVNECNGEVVFETHEIHCDSCDELLTTYTEVYLKDGTFIGYAKQPSAFLDEFSYDVSVELCSCSLHLSKQLCRKCRDAEDAKIRKLLEDNGFKMPTL